MQNLKLWACLISLAAAVSSQALAESNSPADSSEYFVSLLRAAPGEMPNLIKAAQAEKAKLSGDLLIMRHSQGDHWDLMLLWPRSKPATVPRFQQWADFQHDFAAKSTITWETLKPIAAQSNLFHIEMFHAAHGRYAGLLEQRKMENNYLVATQRKANLIFETQFGSDVDLFTLGLYPDMISFATDPDLSDEVFEKAATDAGFKSRSDIGFYLRQFLVGHQDTLATRVD